MPEPPSHPKRTIAEIVGGIIGGLGATLFAFFGTIWYRRRYGRLRRQYEPETGSTPILLPQASFNRGTFSLQEFGSDNKLNEKRIHGDRVEPTVVSRVKSAHGIATHQLSISGQASGSTLDQSRLQEQLRLENENLRLEVQRLRRSSAGTSDAPPSYSEPVLN